MHRTRFFLLILLISTHIESLYAICPLGGIKATSERQFSGIEEPFYISYSPLIGGHLFATTASSSQNNIEAYTVDVITGALTQAPGSPFPAQSQPFFTTYSPLVNGNLFCATANYLDNSLSIYTVDINTGALVEIATSPKPSNGDGPYAITYSPIIAGNLFAAVGNYNDGTVSIYQVNTITGEFTAIGLPYSADLFTTDISFSPIVSGNLFLAVPTINNHKVFVYQINPTTGILTTVPGSPFATGNSPFSIAYSPIVNGNLFAAVANFNGNSTSVYKVNASTGAFTEILGSPFPVGTDPVDFVYSPLIGGNLYAAVSHTSFNNITTYQVDQNTGVLTPIAPPFTTLNNSYGLAYSPILPGGLFLASCNANAPLINTNAVSVYTIITLTPVITTASQVIRNGQSITLNGIIQGGTPPFTLTWSDGFTQVVSGFTFSRTVTPSVPTKYTVVSVTDEDNCTAGPSNQVNIGILASLCNLP